jgi:chloramphenicol-sensitive protein RarD
MNKGIWYAVGAYATWGLLPVYWKWLHRVPALQLLNHRIIWSFLTLFIITGTPLDILLVGSGLVTTIPLLMFASAARRLPLSLLGILQYIAPTLQFLLGVLVYREPFRHAQLIGYGLVWTALILFGVERLIAYRTQSAATAAE